MAVETKIAWTDSTFNPWRGCVKVSDGCKHCYAEGWAKRTGKPIWGKDAAREHASETYWKQPVKWNAEAAKIGKPFRVFCSSLADVCEDRDDLLEPRARLMRLIEDTPNLTWLLVTKRPENFLRFFGRRWFTGWPNNVWAMTTAENQEQADKRLPHLMKVPTVVRGVSYEPALGPVDFMPWILPRATPMIDWIIAGGESGYGARSFHLDWARNVRDQCRGAGVAFFMKQAGADPVMGREDSQIIRSSKGDDPGEWPRDLQVQEFPR